MTFDEMMGRVLEIFPDAEVDERDGEIIIATGLAEDAAGNLVSVVNS